MCKEMVKLQNMKIHDIMQVDLRFNEHNSIKIDVIRVPGGWIYVNRDAERTFSEFVPLTQEGTTFKPGMLLQEGSYKVTINDPKQD